MEFSRHSRPHDGPDNSGTKPPRHRWRRFRAGVACGLWLGLTGAVVSAQETSPPTLPVPEAPPSTSPTPTPAEELTRLLDPVLQLPNYLFNTAAQGLGDMMQVRLPVDSLVNSLEELSDYLGRGYQLGFATVVSPDAPGSSELKLKFRPVLSIRWGDLQITSSQGGLIEGRRSPQRVLGFALTLTESERWSTGVSLRTDGGREASDDPLFKDLPVVEPTLRGRFQIRYRLTHQWSLSSSVSTDLLGQEGGATASLDLSHRTQLAPGWRATVGTGINFGDSVYMNTYYSVPASASSPGGLPVYHAHAGIQAINGGASLAWQFHPRWRTGVSFGVSRLLGQAANSPVTVDPFSYNVAIGIVFVSGRGDATPTPTSNNP